MWANNVVLETVRADQAGNVFFATGQHSGDETLYAAHHFDRRTGDLYTIKLNMKLEDAMKTIGLYREGKNV